MNIFNCPFLSHTNLKCQELNYGVEFDLIDSFGHYLSPSINQTSIQLGRNSLS